LRALAKSRYNAGLNLGRSVVLRAQRLAPSLRDSAAQGLADRAALVFAVVP
jgi:hypothetical protein